MKSTGIANNVLEQLASVVGPEYASDDAVLLEHYSRDQSFVPPRRPNYVALPDTTAQVQELIKIANGYKLPVVPRSSSISLYGATIPDQGGIIIDLKRMNRILDINDRNWQATIEPGVTFTQLQQELQKHGFRVAVPLFALPSASVLSNYMERNPVVTAADFTYGNELIISYEMVMPTGETFTVGHPPLARTAASSPDGPGLNFYKLFQGAQGTLGIATKIVLRVLPVPKARKVFFMPFDRIEDALETIRRIQRRELGLECFALNNFNLAAFLVEEGPAKTERLRQGEYIGVNGANPWLAQQLDEFESLRKELPEWTVIVCLAGVNRFAEEKVEYQKQDMIEAVAELGVVPQPTVGGLAGLETLILDELILPWRMQKRFGYKGSCHGLAFYARPDRVRDYETAIYQVTNERGYSSREIGGYILPIERARAIYCEYDLHCNLEEPRDRERVNKLFEETSELLIGMGAFFDRPYGPWARMIYSRTGSYTEYLKKVKKQFDPNNIMNPGKLCF